MFRSYYDVFQMKSITTARYLFINEQQKQIVQKSEVFRCVDNGDANGQD